MSPWYSIVYSGIGIRSDDKSNIFENYDIDDIEDKINSWIRSKGLKILINEAQKID